MRTSQTQLIQSGSRGQRARALLSVVLAGALALAGAACTREDSGSPSWQGGNPDAGPKASAEITTPAADAADVPAATEIAFSTKDATDSTVNLEDAAGKAVEGALSTDGTTWLPNAQLEYGTTYTATVTATGDDGMVATASHTFTTMAKPAKQIRVISFLGDDQVVGIGMPLIIQFDRSIPEKFRADLQRRMTVQATPVQEGAWHWTSPTEVHYRPKTYWAANSTVSYKVQAGGLPLGDGWYGRADLTVDLKIGSALVMTVDNKTKTMTVSRNNKVIRTIPISLGKASTPSSSGTMVVMEKQRRTIFDTTAYETDPANRYRVKIEYAQRLTWGGEYIHAAPWSVADQGHHNVSHGCVNMSTADASWLFGQSQVGDPVIVKDTEVKLKLGNGWTDWNMSWDEYLKGSAIPYQPPAADPTEEPSAEPDDSSTF